MRPADDAERLRPLHFHHIGVSLGGSVGWASGSGSGHDLAVRGFEPRVGLCADGSEPDACFEVRVFLSLCSSAICSLSLSLSLKNKQTLKKVFIAYTFLGKRRRALLSPGISPWRVSPFPGLEGIENIEKRINIIVPVMNGGPVEKYT